MTPENATMRLPNVVPNRGVDRAAFQPKVKPVWDTCLAENGTTLVNAILAASR